MYAGKKGKYAVSPALFLLMEDIFSLKHKSRITKDDFTNE